MISRLILNALIVAGASAGVLAPLAGPDFGIAAAAKDGRTTSVSFGVLIPPTAPETTFSKAPSPLSGFSVQPRVTFGFLPSDLRIEGAASFDPPDEEAAYAKETPFAFDLRGSLTPDAPLDAAARGRVDISTGTPLDPLLARGWDLTSAQATPRRR